LGPATRRLAGDRGAGAHDRQFHRAGAVGRLAAGLDLRSGPYRGRPIRAGRNEVTQARRRLDAGWLREAPLRDLLAALEGDGEEARVVGGAGGEWLLGRPPAANAPP